MTFHLEEHLRQRSFDPQLYRCVLDKNVPCLTVYLFNLSQQIVGYQIYRPLSQDKKNNDPKTGRYFTYCKNNMIGVFGLEACVFEGPWFVFEGIFKAAKAHSLGYNAIAVLSNNPKRMKPWFRILRQTRDLIGIGDNDTAGQKLVNCVGAGRCSPIDFDEMSDKDAMILLKEQRYRG